MQLAVGTVIDKYALEQKLGEGGMGEVYEARHTLIGRRCAIKLLRAELASNPEVAQRLLREAQAAAAIGHPNIVETFDFGVTADGTTYLVMEYLDGQSLDRLLDDAERLAVRPTAAILVQVLSALVAAHDKGIVHRDLKPENIFIARGRRGVAEVKLLDFGISKFSNMTGQDLRLTKTGTVVGTPFYMSPEQATDTQNVDARSDLWSAGVILYECLTGRLPYEAKNYNQQIVAIITGTHVPLQELEPAVPDALAAVVERALQKKPENRFSSATQMIEALLPYYDREAVEVGPFSLQPSLLVPTRELAQTRAGPARADLAEAETAYVPQRDTVATGAPDPESSDEWVEYSLPTVLGTPDTREPLRDDPSQPRVEIAPPPADAQRLGPHSLSPSQVIATGQPRTARWRWPLIIGGGASLLVIAGVLIAVLISRGDSGDRPEKPAGPQTAMTSTPAMPADPMTRPLDTPKTTTKPRPETPRLVIQLKGLPKEALVFVDGRDAVNPITLKADDKSHTVEVEAPGYQPFKKRVTAKAGQMTLQVKMSRLASLRSRRRHVRKVHRRHIRQRYRPHPPMTMSGLYDDPHSR